MLAINSFSPSVIQRIGHYVYCLKDPDTGKVFYVGKGQGNRIFDHLKIAVSTATSTSKLDKIRAIQAAGRHPEYLIIRSGLTEESAIQVEAALIEWIGVDNLTNEVSGHHSDGHGIMNIAELVALYEAPSANIVEPVILIIINKLYERGKMTDEALYEATRGDWVIGQRRNGASYALAVHDGIVRQAYRIHKWQAAPKNKSGRQRWRFYGEVSREVQGYIGKSVSRYIARGAQNPIKYVNC